ncbi:MAG: hypothetical protein HC915_21350, partial [Anaerolineae bacterium]|nr:hypothetical protein [Anaerolineae bacterium]
MRLEVTATQDFCQAEVRGTFSIENWEAGLPVRVSIVDDGDIQAGARSCVLRHVLVSEDDPAYNLPALDLPEVSVVVNDDEFIGFAFSETEIEVTEGEAVTYVIRLGSVPGAPVQLGAVSSAFDCAVTLEGNTLDAENWDEGLTVRVEARPNDVAQPDRECEIRHSASSTDPSYRLSQERMPVVMVGIADDDVAGVVIGPGEIEIAEGGVGSYLITLTSVPTAPVSVVVSSSEARCQATVLGALNATNWNTGVTVGVTVVDDARNTGDAVCVLSHSTSSDDANYALEADALAQVEVQVRDDDALPLGVPEGDLRVVEGESLTLPLVLIAAPTEEVALSVESDAAACGLSFPETLDAETWQGEAAVTVTVEDNRQLDGERTCTLRYALSSEDPNYADFPLT